MKYPKGYPINGMLRIAISLTEPEFKSVIRRAKKDDKNFNDMARELIRIGVFDLDESDDAEPMTELQNAE